MITKTKLTPANASKTLRTTVPMALVRLLDLEPGSELEWHAEIRDSEIAIRVRPVALVAAE